MPIDFLSNPTDLRRTLKRLATSAEEVELFVSTFDDASLAKLLISAAQRGAEVNLTLNLDPRTNADLLDKLIEAGVNVGIFKPREFRKRKIAAFHPGVFLFDNLTTWKTAAIVGSFDATTESLEKNLEAATLIESDDFSSKNEAGVYLIKLLKWIDNLNFEPLTEKMRSDHREEWEALQRLKKAAQRSDFKPSGDNAFAVEVKFISPLSWQELRGCVWEDYFRGLLDAERQRPAESSRRITGEIGWLTGIDDAQYAFREGPERWCDPEVSAELTGSRSPADCLGCIENDAMLKLLENSSDFRHALHEAIELCVSDPARGTILHALAPVLEWEGVSVAVLTRFLAASAPDRFVSILDDDMKLRLSDIVGFDVSGEGLSPLEHLGRYADAIDQIHGFPWASTLSAERSTDHPDEAEAWSKRAALLGCFVC